MVFARGTGWQFHAELISDLLCGLCEYALLLYGPEKNGSSGPMKIVKLLFAVVTAIVLVGCSTPKLLPYDGPEITKIVVLKEERKMFLLNGNKAIRTYDFELGFAPTGDKKIYGDGKTPEGAYFIDRKNPNSKFHLSLGISYPNARDRAEAARLGKNPGGDIFIHGTPKKFRRDTDWTWGCIAVTDREIEEIYSMVKVGTPILIYP